MQLWHNLQGLWQQSETKKPHSDFCVEWNERKRMKFVKSETLTNDSDSEVSTKLSLAKIKKRFLRRADVSKANVARRVRGQKRTTAIAK